MSVLGGACRSVIGGAACSTSVVACACSFGSISLCLFQERRTFSASGFDVVSLSGARDTSVPSGRATSIWPLIGSTCSTVVLCSPIHKVSPLMVFEIC